MNVIIDERMIPIITIPKQPAVIILAMIETNFCIIVDNLYNFKQIP